MSAVTSRAAIAPRFPLRIVGVVALLLIALLVGAVLFTGSQRHLPAPFGLAAAGRLAYSANGDIFSADPVTGAKTAIVTGPETDVHPVWSLDGTRVVFERKVYGDTGDGRLFVARADGTGLVAITPDPQSLLASYAFSPDGTEVAFMAGPTATSVLWIAKTDGSGARQIDVGMSAFEPWFRPRDGAELIFAGNPGTGTGNGIYAVSLSTGVVRTIVAPSVGIEIDRITVAPDGSRVAYSAATDGSAGNSYRVMVTGIDGSGTVTMPMPAGATFQDAAAWSNDSSSIALVRGYGLHNEAMTLAVLPASGSGGVGTETARGLTGCCDTVLGWSPDDRSILVSPEDLSGNFTPQLLWDPVTGSTRATPQAAIGDPAWQRVSP